MKKLFIYIILALPSFAFSQTSAITAAPPVTPVTNFTINAIVGHLNAPAQAYLFYQLGANKVVDSAKITQGAFKFTGTVIDPGQAYLVIDHAGAGANKIDSKTADVLIFFVEKGTVNITSATDSISKAQITGSETNDAYKRLTALLTPISVKAQKLKAEEDAAPATLQSTDAYQSAENAKHKALGAEQTATFKNFVKENPNNYLSLLVISQMGPTTDAAELLPLYNLLGQNLKDMEAGKMIKTSIDALLPTSIGAIAPDFTQNDVSGKPVSLSSFKGKYVLIDFWASWCGPCRAENPTVVKAYNKFKAKNFTVLGVSLDKESGKADWIAAIKSDGLTWTQVSDLNYWSNKAALLYAVQSIPHNFLLDPTGKIIAKDLRGSDLDDKLTQIFGKM